MRTDLENHFMNRRKGDQRENDKDNQVSFGGSRQNNV